MWSEREEVKREKNQVDENQGAKERATEGQSLNSNMSEKILSNKFIIKKVNEVSPMKKAIS